MANARCDVMGNLQAAGFFIFGGEFMRGVMEALLACVTPAVSLPTIGAETNNGLRQAHSQAHSSMLERRT